MKNIIYPINKKDFDPIYNEFSAKEEDDDENEIAKETTAKTYRLLKQIADRSNSGEICRIQDLEEYDREILKSLLVRGVLVDENGKDISRDDFDSLSVKIKVRLFAIWLRERG